MTREMLAAILESEGAKSGPTGLTLPDGTQVTCFVSTTGEVLQVPRVARVAMRDNHVQLVTNKNERFYFACEDVIGLRCEAGDPVRDRGTGFVR